AHGGRHPAQDRGRDGAGARAPAQDRGAGRAELAQGPAPRLRPRPPRHVWVGQGAPRGPAGVCAGRLGGSHIRLDARSSHVADAGKSKASKKGTQDYGASSITVLEGLEAVRLRPGMYIGSTGLRGLHHLIWEVVDNSVDEAMAGHATGVNVTLLEDGGVEVVDDGRGIPVEMHESGMPTVQVVMTQLHAGGKFDSDSYAVSGGLHGVGISVVNALSTRVEVQIKRDGRLWNQDFHMAVPAELVDAGPATGSGTRVRFWADPDIFESTDYDFDVV